MNPHRATGSAVTGDAGRPAREDRPVTIAELRASSRVRFWVPPQLMAEFFDADPADLAARHAPASVGEEGSAAPDYMYAPAR